MTFGLLLALSLTSGSAHARGILHWHGDKLFLTTAEGKTATLATNLYSDRISGQIFVGGRQPKLSPDGSIAAFIATDGNLWIAFTDGRPHKKISSSGTSTAGWNSVQVFITSWSPDSHKLIFHQRYSYASGRAAGPAIFEGFRLYNVATDTLSDLPNLPRHLFWTADSNGIIFGKEFEEPPDGLYSYSRMDLATGATNFFCLSPAGPLLQIDPFSDGKKIAFSSGHSISIAKFCGKRSRQISKAGALGDYSWPSPSPNGKWLVYSHRIGGVDSNKQDWVLHKLRAIFHRDIHIPLEDRFMFPFQWLDDFHVGVVASDEKAWILDIRNKKVQSVAPPN